MKRAILLICVLFALTSKAQIGSVKTEAYQASFEKTQSIDLVSEYNDTIKIPIQLLKIGINEELYEQQRIFRA